MRVSNDRYRRDLRSIDLAHRMLLQEAWTRTICAWTGLTGDRVRNLARTLQGGASKPGVTRHRGPSPISLSAVMSNRRMRSEVAAAAGLCRVLKVLPSEPMPRARSTLPGLARGERLLDAFELFRTAIPHTQLTLEQLILVVVTLAEGDAWALDHCALCPATIVVDQLAMAPRRTCAHCRIPQDSGTGDLDLVSEDAITANDLPPEGNLQQRLFE